jgi:ABC-2 type transport system permease protein
VRCWCLPTNNILAGIALGQVMIGVLGVLTMTSEYSSGMIRATLAAVPRRPLLLAAKATVFGAVALATGQIACFAAFLTGVAFLQPTVPHPALSQPAVLRAVALTSAYLGLIGLIGLGLGAIIRHSAAAITTLVGAVFVVPALGLALTPAGKFLPMLIAANSLGAVKPQTSAGMLPPWAGLGVISLYAAILLATGGSPTTEKERDVSSCGNHLRPDCQRPWSPARLCAGQKFRDGVRRRGVRGRPARRDRRRSPPPPSAPRRSRSQAGRAPPGGQCGPGDRRH